MKIIALFIEVLGWLRIVASPLLIGSIIGALIYMKWEKDDGLVMALLVAGIGLVVGIIWAITIWFKHGTTNYLSKLEATPELDNHDIHKNN